MIAHLYGLQLSAETERFFKKLRDQGLAERLRKAINNLRLNPHPAGCRKLKGSLDKYRVRVGHYRIIYRVENAALVILIVAIGDRKDIYR